MFFVRDGSEKSFSDSSEKSWKKGPRTSSRNDNKSKLNKKFDKPRDEFRGKSFSPRSSIVDEQSWNVSSVSELPDLAPADAVFSLLDVQQTTTQVVISWFHNPGYFYCQLVDNLVSKKCLLYLSYKHKS